MPEDKHYKKLLKMLGEQLDEHGQIDFLKAANELGLEFALLAAVDCGPDEETHPTLGAQHTACTKDEAETKVVNTIIFELEQKRLKKCNTLNCPSRYECSTEILDYVASVQTKLVFNRIRINGCPHRVGWICKWPGGDVKSRCSCATTV